MRVRALGLLAVVALVVASCGGGTPEAAGPSEGIQVHGDWTIDVINPDGSLDQHLEFDNALVSTGRRFLAMILSAEASPGPWTIKLISSSSNEICLDGAVPHNTCKISVGVPTETYEFGGLQLNRLTDVVQLSGSLTASRTGEISSVETGLALCLSSVAPDDCTLSFTDPIVTSKFLLDPVSGADAPVAVTAGQTVQIQVDISFTSG